MHAIESYRSYCAEHRQKQLRNAYYKITHNLGLLFEYLCTSGKFIRLPLNLPHGRQLKSVITEKLKSRNGYAHNYR